MPTVKLSDKTTRTAASISDETITYFVGIEIDGSPELFKMATPQLRTLLGIGGVSDGDKGDIVISSAGTVYTIDSGVLSAYGRTLTVTANAAAARGVLGLGTSATLNVGVNANNVVQLDGTSKLPAVDGSQLTNLPGAANAITALTGNVTASGPGSAVATIANDAVTTAKILNSNVTYAKIQNVTATDKLLGRSTAGAGVVEEIACTAAGRDLLDDANAAAQRTTLGLGSLATQSGTFSGTSSGTNTGDQTITLTGDVTGSGTGSFAATIANNAVTYGKMQAANAVSRLVGSSDASTALTNITLGTNLSMSGSTLNAASGGGTPGGSNTHVQFNNSGAFGGAAGLTWDGTNLAATNLRVGDGTLGAPSLAFTSDADGTGTGLYRSDANEIAVAINGVRQINLSGATAGTGAIRLNNTYTDGTNYERGVFQWVSNVLHIGTTALGTGTQRAIVIGVEPATALKPKITINTNTSVYVEGATGSNSHIGAPNGNCYIGQTNNFGATVLIGNAGFRVGANVPLAWSNDATSFGTADIGIGRTAAGILTVTNASTGGGSVELREQTAPAAGAANTVRIYAEDNGAGKTRLMALFNTGAAQQIAIEP